MTFSLKSHFHNHFYFKNVFIYINIIPLILADFFQINNYVIIFHFLYFSFYFNYLHLLLTSTLENFLLSFNFQLNVNLHFVILIFPLLLPLFYIFIFNLKYVYVRMRRAHFVDLILGDNYNLLKVIQIFDFSFIDGIKLQTVPRQIMCLRWLYCY